MRSRTLTFLNVATVFLIFPCITRAQTVNSQTILSGTVPASGLYLGLNSSDGRTDWLSNDGTSLIMRYPGAASIWGAVFITSSLALERPGMDMSGYKTLVLEVNGAAGTSVDIGIKDSTQPDDGTETKLPIQLTGDWQTYQIPVSKFTGADLKKVYVLAEFVFLGSQSQTVAVRSIRYTSAPAATTKILPQFAFGGGWYSAVYFTNMSLDAVSFPVHFIGDSGQPLLIPSIAGTEGTVILPPRGTAVIEAFNAGALTAGYVSAELPDGVVGYAVFRESIPGYPDQEAVVPLSGASATTSTMIWDETNYSTAVAMVNPSSQRAAVTIVLYDSSGQTVGTSSLTLEAGNKIALFLRQIAGLGGAVGKRGSADFKVSSGRIAVLGIRFNGAAFTSIPTTDK